MQNASPVCFCKDSGNQAWNGKDDPDPVGNLLLVIEKLTDDDDEFLNFCN